jgi:hypothetical protein
MESRSPFSPPKAESDFSESKPVASAFGVPHPSKIATTGQPQLSWRKGGPASRTWKIAKRVTVVAEFDAVKNFFRIEIQPLPRVTFRPHCCWLVTVLSSH